MLWFLCASVCVWFVGAHGGFVVGLWFGLLVGINTRIGILAQFGGFVGFMC